MGMCPAALTLPGSGFSAEAHRLAIVLGVDAPAEVPLARWDFETWFSSDSYAEGKTYTRHGSYLQGAELFDPSAFGITPFEASGMNPVQRLGLEVGYEALWRAGMERGALTDQLISHNASMIEDRRNRAPPLYYGPWLGDSFR